MKFTTAITSAVMASILLTSGVMGQVKEDAAACLRKCDLNDISCISTCIGAPNPSNQAAIKTNQCIQGCPRGSGAAEDLAVYFDCNNACIKEHFMGVTPPAPVVNSAEVTTQENGEVRTQDSSDMATKTSGTARPTETSDNGSGEGDRTESSGADAIAHQKDMADFGFAVAAVVAVLVYDMVM